MHYLDPQKKNAHVLIVYRNFAARNTGQAYSHIGLGVNALHTAKVLRRHNIRCDIAGVWLPDEIRPHLRSFCPTHVVIEAPWIPMDAMVKMMYEFPHVHFIVRAHSQIGFLQVEAGAIKLLRDLLLAQEMHLNLTVSSNAKRLCDFVRRTYNARCVYLPNLYDIERQHRKPEESHHHRKLRISSFGALRLLKNHTTAAAAAMMIAESRGCDLEFWISVNREENGKGILDSLRNMFQGVQWAKLVEHPWEEWSAFRRTVRHMDLCIQTSFTETFNIVTADAVSEGVPCVVSSAIEWTPKSWQADSDSAEDVARVGSHLLWDTHASEEGFRALQRYYKEGIEIWENFLGSNPT